MFFVGTKEIGPYVVSVQPSPMELMEHKFYLDDKLKALIAPYTKPYEYLDREYYHCSVTKKIDTGYAMIDLNKDEKFDCISFQFPPKPIKYKAKKNKFRMDEDEKEIVPPTPEELIYETEYRYWRHNHDLNTYLDCDLYLHRTTIEKVITKCLL